MSGTVPDTDLETPVRDTAREGRMAEEKAADQAKAHANSNAGLTTETTTTTKIEKAKKAKSDSDKTDDDLQQQADDLVEHGGE